MHTAAGAHQCGHALEIQFYSIWLLENPSCGTVLNHHFRISTVQGRSNMARISLRSKPPSWAKVVPAPNRRCRPCACPVCPRRRGQGQQCAWRSVWKEARTWKKGCLAVRCRTAVQLKNVGCWGCWGRDHGLTCCLKSRGCPCYRKFIRFLQSRAICSIVSCRSAGWLRSGGSLFLSFERNAMLWFNLSIYLDRSWQIYSIILQRLQIVVKCGKDGSHLGCLQHVGASHSILFGPDASQWSWRWLWPFPPHIRLNHDDVPADYPWT